MLKKIQKSYSNENWLEFSNKVQSRDGYKCLKCGRKKGEAVLQAHHKLYRPGLKLWDYPPSDCITLCKGCHAQIHGIIEPSSGWILVSIDDLGGDYGTCEKTGCNNDIRYEHLIYHPEWGYKVVGSTCVEFLTSEDQYLSHEVVKVYKKISDFITKSEWKVGYSKNHKKYYFTKFSHHQINIYPLNNCYLYIIGIKEKGVKWLNYQEPIYAYNKTLPQVKELGFIVLKGTITDNIEEKNILRNIYKNTR